jgi:transposase
MSKAEELTEEQWAVVLPLLPAHTKRKDGRGRPAHGHREVLNGIFWILRSGARWQDLPDRFPSYASSFG